MPSFRIAAPQLGRSAQGNHVFVDGLTENLQAGQPAKRRLGRSLHRESEDIPEREVAQLFAKLVAKSTLADRLQHAARALELVQVGPLAEEAIQKVRMERIRRLQPVNRIRLLGANAIDGLHVGNNLLADDGD